MSSPEFKAPQHVYRPHDSSTILTPIEPFQGRIELPVALALTTVYLLWSAWISIPLGLNASGNKIY